MGAWEQIQSIHKLGEVAMPLPLMSPIVMAKYRYSWFKKFDGRGGPVVEIPSEQATQTRAGRYVVGAIMKHRSASRWVWSTVLWGTPLRLENNIVQIKESGTWVPLKSKRGFSTFSNAEIVQLVTDAYQNYKKDLGPLLTSAEKTRAIPDTWIFNDFGHLSIKYFRDKNKNYKHDAGEDFMSDFIHTVPREELFAAHGKLLPLEDSHGCIHVHPNDIDTIVSYIKIGSVIEIHPYGESTVPVGFDRDFGRPPLELHFFPHIAPTTTAGNLILYKVKKV